MSLSSRPCRCAVLLFCALALSRAGLSAQNQNIRSEQKLGALSGGFGGTISDDARFGVDVALIGDLDDDGFVEVAVGAHREDDGGDDRGAVWILSLQTDGTVRSQRKISSVFGGFTGRLLDGDRFGVALEGLGDFDGDGIEDLAVGAYRDDDGASNAGAVWLLFLNSDGTVKGHRKISATQGGFTGQLDENDSFGWAIKMLDDLDGDGVPELAVAACRDDDGWVDTGAVWILFLNADGTVKGHTKLSASSGGALLGLTRKGRFGGDICVINDLDGDGVNELVVAAFGEEVDHTGELWILFLRNDGSFKDAVRIGDSAGGFAGTLEGLDRFGISLAAGDLDGDGIEDLIVGATGDDDGGEDRGALWVLMLKSNGTVASTYKINSLSGGFGGAIDDGDEFGNASALLGDIDGDGVGDLIVGSFLDDEGGIDRGSVWVLFRACTLPQPGADFTVVPRVSLAPFEAVFQDLSSGDITSWFWDFGDGGTSTLETPTHEYTFQGMYDVRLVVSGSNGSDEILRKSYIVAETPPVAPTAAFEATPMQGLAPLDVSFSDRTVGEVTAWLWDFGDGSAAVEANPLHRYTDLGSYFVSLLVSGPLGVDMTVPAQPIVVLEPAPVAMYSAAPILGEAPLSVSFVDVSSGNINAWNWSFGDGATSNEQNPIHVFEFSGTYTVRLDVASGGGSSSYELPGLILVSPPPAGSAFSATPSQGTAPLSVVFRDRSTGGVQNWSWDFGDGSSSSLQHPTHTYVGVGNYTTTLRVDTDAGFFTAARDIEVLPMPAIAEFLFAPDTGVAPLAVFFEDLSTGSVTGWQWDFGDGAHSSLPDPTHVYTTPGVYDVSLWATNLVGTDLLTKAAAIQVLEPLVADFTFDVASGVLPLPVAFQDTSSGTATAWSWDFGDGAVSSQASPIHIYSLAGTYAVALTVWRGAQVSTHSEDTAITVRPPLLAAFMQDAVSGAAPLSVAFADASSGAPSTWTWTFGDGSSAVGATTTHVFSQPGSYEIRLDVTRGSESATALGNVLVSEPAPLVDFALMPGTGTAPLVVSFLDRSTGAVTSHLWDFGDGATSTLENPVHNYTTAGSYAVSLTVSNAGGSDTLVRQDAVVLQPPVPLAADFQVDLTIGFEPLTVRFSDLSTGGPTAWFWDFGDGQVSSLAHPSHIYLSSGAYSVALTVSAPTGSDSITKADLVFVIPTPLIPDFDAAPQRGRAPHGVAFTDLSTGPVTQWDWDFGDGQSSTLQHPTHVYLSPGLFSVRLLIRGGGGIGTVTWPDLIHVLRPRLWQGGPLRWGGNVLIGAPPGPPGWPVGLQNGGQRGAGGLGKAPLDPSLIGLDFSAPGPGTPSSRPKVRKDSVISSPSFTLRQ